MAGNTARRTDRFWGPPDLHLNGPRSSLPGEKQQMNKSDRSPVSMAEISNEWSSCMAVRRSTV
jgi:hypothetical protein